MLIEDETLLKAWIANVVEDISDAEPDALAKYVIALVKKPLSDADLERLCAEKLSVFLQSHTDTFVSQLFNTLKSGKYMTKTVTSSSQEAVKPIIIHQKHGEKIEEKLAAESDELVLTDGESEHEQEKEEPQLLTKTTTTRGDNVQSGSKITKSSEQFAPRSSVSSKEEFSGRRNIVLTERTKIRAASPLPTGGPISKPLRKRISPPRSTSAERRARSPLPPRRRVILTSGAMRVSSNRPSERDRERHYRSGGGGGGGGRNVVVVARSRSKSPHRKEKRTSEAEVRISRRHRCRDFHEKGFCMRGDNCPFDHGPDPVVVENSALKDIVRDTALFDASSACQYFADSLNPPPPGLEGAVTTALGGSKPLGGVATEGYNPEAPSMDSSAATVHRIDFSVPPPPIPQQLIHQQQRATLAQSHQLLYPPGIAPSHSGPSIPSTAILPAFTTVSLGIVPGAGPPITVVPPTAVFGNTASITTTSTACSTFNRGIQLQSSEGMAMRGGRFKPYIMTNRNLASRSLLVRKIPPELNKIAQIDQHFNRFGQVTNIQVQYEGRSDSALVTFKTRRDAMQAFKSTEPIFNNRFIKVFWQSEVNAAATDTELANQIEESGGPTIPLVDSRLALHPRSHIKVPIQNPVNKRCFTKVFLSQQKKEENAITEENIASMEHQEPVTEPISIQSAVGMNAQQAFNAAQPPRPPIYNKMAALKKRLAAERETMNKLAEVQKMKANLYTELIEQQKNLLMKLAQTKDKESKRKIIAFLKTLEPKVKGVKVELEELTSKMLELQMQQLQHPSKRPRRASNGTTKTEGNGGANEHQQLPNKPASPNKKLLKLCRVVYVSDCPIELSEKLILHMERFGELFDYDINATPRIFTYKEPLDAQKAVNEAASSFVQAKLRVEWAPVAKGVKSAKDVIPDVERKPSEQVAAKDLLASLDYDEEEEEDEKKNEDEDDESDVVEDEDATS